MSLTDAKAEGEAPASNDESPAAPGGETPPPTPKAAPASAPVIEIASKMGDPGASAPAAGIASKAAGDIASALAAEIAAQAAPADAPVIEMGPSTEDSDANGPVIELGLDAVDLPMPGESPAPAPLPSVPSFMAAAAASEGPAVAPPGAVVQAERYRPPRWLLGAVAFLVAAADLGTKEWAKHALAGPDLKRSSKHFEAIRDHMDFIFAQNPGGAWSFLRGVPDGIRRPFFLFVSAAAIVFIVNVYSRLEKRQWAMRWGLPLALGGAIGNLADRMRYGWVVDFVDVYYKRGGNEMHWPTFNVADIAIVIGVGLMALDLLSLRRPKAPSAPATTTEPASGAA